MTGMPAEIDGGLKLAHKKRYSVEQLNLFKTPYNDIYEAISARGYVPGSHVVMLVCDTSAQDDVDRQALVDAFETLNGGHVYVGEVEEFTYAIIFSNGPRDYISLSYLHIMPTLEILIHEPFGLLCGTSQAFEDLRGCDSAFKQCLYALEYREYYVRELNIMREPIDIRIIPGAAFEQVLPYYLVEESSTDDAFVNFCLSQAFLTTILADDIRHNTKNFQILWFYLAYECNASVVGRRMFMHRNSVLYHLKQLENRYDFDLSRRHFREKLLLDYRMVFMNLSEASLKTLFDD